MKKYILFSVLLITLFCIPPAFAMKENPQKKTQRKKNIEFALFPVNLAPNIVSNTVVFLFNPVVCIMAHRGVSNLWPIVSFLSPAIGPLCGIKDAWYGYPFWNPVALDEHRKYN